MNDFQLTSDLACDILDAAGQVIQYPIGDNNRYLDLRVKYYQDGTLDRFCGYRSDVAKDIIRDNLRALEAYLREPTGDNYIYLQNHLLRYQTLHKAYKDEVTADE